MSDSYGYDIVTRLLHYTHDFFLGQHAGFVIDQHQIQQITNSDLSDSLRILQSTLYDLRACYTVQADDAEFQPFGHGFGGHDFTQFPSRARTGYRLLRTSQENYGFERIRNQFIYPICACEIGIVFVTRNLRLSTVQGILQNQG